MTAIHSLISFYRDCFEEENKGGGIANFLAAKVEHHTLVKGKDDHLSGMIPYLPIEEGLAKKLQAQVTLYEKEKEFVYGAFFILGSYTGMSGRQMRLTAPLMLYSCEIVHEGEFYYVKADLQNGTFNPSVIRILKSADPSFDEDSFYKELPVGPVDSAMSGKLSRLLDKYMSGLDSSFMVDYPNNWSSYKINKAHKSGGLKDRYQMVSASGFGLVKKSLNTRSILSELDLLSKEENNYSHPIKALFEPGSMQKVNTKEQVINPVSVLSNSQERVLKAGSKYALSMVIGPPGTGKSFTISNLAINMMSQGESVLVCSRNDGALNVIDHQIASILGNENICIKGGKRNEIKLLKKRLEFLLSRGSINDSNILRRKNGDTRWMEDREQTMAKIRKQLNEYLLKFEEADIEELTSGAMILKYDSSDKLWNRLIRYYLSKKADFKSKSPLWEVTELYISLIEKMTKTTKDFVTVKYEERLRNTIVSNRWLLKNYLQSLRATNTERQKKFFESIDLQELFKVFPVWLTTTKDAGELLPLKKEIFDVVIVDEASQCDIATCLPLFQRAKRVIIVGDPKQLRHISFLSKGRQYQLQKKQGFSEEEVEYHSYRNKSILDLAEIAIQDQEQSNFLDEHYRSHPDIIAFSNQKFYFDELKVMTADPTNQKRSLFQVKVNGGRNEKGENREEAIRIIEQLKQLIQSEKTVPLTYKQSVGILSPFRGQVDFMVELIQQELSIQEIQEHRILIGTAHSFQGEERDCMFLSFVLTNDSHASAFRFLNKEDVFNVSITRAKHTQYVMTSFDETQLSHDYLLRQYVESIHSSETLVELEEEFDEFSKEVCAYVNGLMLNTIVPYTVGGVAVDIIVEKRGELFGIDLVGFPGPYERTIDLYKYKALLRVGVKMIPVPYSLWRFKREACELKINEFLGLEKRSL